MAQDHGSYISRDNYERIEQLKLWKDRGAMRQLVLDRLAKDGPIVIAHDNQQLTDVISERFRINSAYLQPIIQAVVREGNVAWIKQGDRIIGIKPVDEPPLPRSVPVSSVPPRYNEIEAKLLDVLATWRFEHPTGFAWNQLLNVAGVRESSATKAAHKRFVSEQTIIEMLDGNQITSVRHVDGAELPIWQPERKKQPPQIVFEPPNEASPLTSATSVQEPPRPSTPRRERVRSTEQRDRKLVVATAPIEPSGTRGLSPRDKTRLERLQTQARLNDGRLTGPSLMDLLNCALGVELRIGWAAAMDTFVNDPQFKALFDYARSEGEIVLTLRASGTMVSPITRDLPAPEAEPEAHITVKELSLLIYIDDQPGGIVTKRAAHSDVLNANLPDPYETPKLLDGAIVAMAKRGIVHQASTPKKREYVRPTDRGRALIAEERARRAASAPPSPRTDDVPVIGSSSAEPLPTRPPAGRMLDLLSYLASQPEGRVKDDDAKATQISPRLAHPYGDPNALNAVIARAYDRGLCDQHVNGRIRKWLCITDKGRLLVEASAHATNPGEESDDMKIELTVRRLLILRLIRNAPDGRLLRPWPATVAGFLPQAHRGDRKTLGDDLHYLDDKMLVTSEHNDSGRRSSMRLTERGALMLNKHEGRLPEEVMGAMPTSSTADAADIDTQSTDTSSRPPEPEGESLEISRDFRLSIDVVSARFFIVGSSGSGKSNTATVLAEEMITHGWPAAIIDVDGSWYGLRADIDGTSGGLPIFIFGGEHADIPIAEDDGAEVARIFCRDRLPMVIDLSDMDREERFTFIREFTNEVYELNPQYNNQPLHIFYDEIDSIAPRQHFNIETVRALRDISKRGRKRGIGMTAITQRPSSVDIDVRSQNDLLIALRLAELNDVKAIDEWIGHHQIPGGDDKRLKHDISSLEPGTAYWWSSQFIGGMYKLRARFRRTFDSAASPTPSRQIKAMTYFAPVDLDRIGETRLTSPPAVEVASTPDDSSTNQHEPSLAATGGTSAHLSITTNDDADNPQSPIESRPSTHARPTDRRTMRPKRRQTATDAMTTRAIKDAETEAADRVSALELQLKIAYDRVERFEQDLLNARQKLRRAQLGLA